MDADDVAAIRDYLGIDLNDPAVRQRAWRRIRVFRSVINECEADGRLPTATSLRGICHRAMVDHDAMCLAILAGLEHSDDQGAGDDSDSLI